MATLLDEAMESYAYPSYNPYSYRYQPPKGKGGQGAWRPRSSYLSSYSEAVAAAAAAEYFDNYQRAQLKAILSQVNPNLTPRLRKANTKEVGVQVNPRQDASVQCSLGPRPLLFRSRARGGGGGGGGGEQEQGCPVSGAPRSVRFPRTIAVYSPVASRRLTTFLEEAERREPSTLAAGPPPGIEGDAVAVAAAARAVWPKGEEESGAESQERKKKSASVPDGAGSSPTKGQAEKEWKGEGGKAAAAVAAPITTPPLAREEAEPNKARVRFQNCKQTRCSCPVKLRHVDPKRPHRQDLCGRCKGKRLSCDSTFSFKYII
ncbi:hypothetical protein Chor_000820 [Crotalus horridus]